MNPKLLEIRAVNAVGCHFRSIRVKEIGPKMSKASDIKTGAALHTSGFETVKISGPVTKTGKSIIFECRTPASGL
jgi:hypothetical protein